MSGTIIGLSAVFCYLAAGILLGWRLSRTAGAETPGKGGILAVGFVAIALHVLLLYRGLFTAQGIDIGFFNAVSLLTWLIALLLLVTAINRPVENLGIAVLPLAALAIVMEQIFHTEHLIQPDRQMLDIHILISMLAYSMLTIAALQAALLAIQDKHLHEKHPGGFIRALPPLQTMESLLFQMIGLGFVMQSLSLISGMIFLEDMFAQHLVHKTFLSIVAWLVFAILLWGRWRYGWRGKTAIRWTLGGFISLLLAYLGSKLVLELLLGY